MDISFDIVRDYELQEREDAQVLKYITNEVSKVGEISSLLLSNYNESHYCSSGQGMNGLQYQKQQKFGNGFSVAADFSSMQYDEGLRIDRGGRNTVQQLKEASMVFDDDEAFAFNELNDCSESFLKEIGVELSIEDEFTTAEPPGPIEKLRGEIEAIHPIIDDHHDMTAAGREYFATAAKNRDLLRSELEDEFNHHQSGSSRNSIREDSILRTPDGSNRKY